MDPENLTVAEKIKHIRAHEDELSEKERVRARRGTKLAVLGEVASTAADIVVGALAPPVATALTIAKGARNIYNTVSHSDNLNEYKSKVITKDHVQTVGHLVLDNIPEDKRNLIIAEAKKIPSKAVTKMEQNLESKGLRIVDVEDICHKHCPKMQGIIEEAVQSMQPEQLAKVAKYYVSSADRGAVLAEVIKQAKELRMAMEQPKPGTYNPFIPKKPKNKTQSPSTPGR